MNTTTLSNPNNPVAAPGFVRRVWWLPSAAGVVAAIFAAASVDPYLAYVATSWVIFGLIGLSLDLVWGRAGVLRA